MIEAEEEERESEREEGKSSENEQEALRLYRTLAYRQHAIRAALSNPLSNILTAHLDCTSMFRRGSQLWSNNVTALQLGTSIYRSHGSPETVTAPSKENTAVFKVNNRFWFTRYVIKGKRFAKLMSIWRSNWLTSFIRYRYCLVTIFSLFVLLC